MTADKAAEQPDDESRREEIRAMSNDVASSKPGTTDQRASAQGSDAEMLARRASPRSANPESEAHQSQGETPRTDLFERAHRGAPKDWAENDYKEALGHARQLERELDDLKHDIDRYVDTNAQLATENDTLKRDAEQLAKYIVHRGQDTRDHACKQCAPNAEFLIEGFVCAFHKAIAIDAARKA